MAEVNFEEVYRMYFQPVYRYVYSLCGDSHVSEEITQQTFYQALKHIGGFEEKCKIQVWLCQIAKNLYFNHVKKEKRHVTMTEGEEPYEECDLLLKLEEKEQVFELHRLLHGLKEPYKEVFMQRIFGELSFAQIGRIFGKSEGWARVTFYRAKVVLMERMEE